MVELLEYWGLVTVKDGRFYWYEYRRGFKSRLEYQSALEHSRKLANDFDAFVREVTHLPEYPPRTAIIFARSSGTELREYITQHLKQCYPRIWAVVEKAEELKKRLLQKREQFRASVMSKRSKLGIPDFREGKEEGVYPDNVFEVIYYGLAAVSKRAPPPAKMKVEDGKLCWNGTTLARGSKNELGLVENFVNKEVGSSENQRYCRKLIELEDEFGRLAAELAKELIELRHKVEHGTPLDGLCDLCPSFREPIE